MTLQWTSKFMNDQKKCKQKKELPVRLFIMRMAEAPAASATFALDVKLQLPRCTRMTSPVSYQIKDPIVVEFIKQQKTQAFNQKSRASHASEVSLWVELSGTRKIEANNTLFFGLLQQSGGSAMATLIWLARFSFDSKVGPNRAPTPTNSSSSWPLIQVGIFTYCIKPRKKITFHIQITCWPNIATTLAIKIYVQSHLIYIIVHYINN